MQVKKLWAILCLLFLFSCNAEWLHGVKAVLENKSSVPISVYFFDKGVLTDSLHIPAQKDFLYFTDAIIDSKTKPSNATIRPDFGYSRYFVRDSVVVVFDGLHSVTHYWDTIPPTEKSAKFFYYEDKRNFTNHDNFELEVKEKSRQTVNYIFTYTFTEEDYRFAKE